MRCPACGSSARLAKSLLGTSGGTRETVAKAGSDEPESEDARPQRVYRCDDCGERFVRKARDGGRKPSGDGPHRLEKNL